MIDMKKILAILMVTAGAWTSCTSDREIKADITVKAGTAVEFAGVSYTVKDQLVILTGTCPSYFSKQKVLQTIKSIGVVKGVEDHIVIAPVMFTTDLPLKQHVDSLLADHPLVTAFVKNGTVTLSGQAKQKEVGQLLTSIRELHPKELRNAIQITAQP
jgi:osmotically-inducible protein OsmY